MNPTLTVIENRRSVRKYASTPLNDDEKEAIVHAAMRAPTAGNMMFYSIIEIEYQSIKDQLAVLATTNPLSPKRLFLLFRGRYHVNLILPILRCR
jgi:nitroreductase